MARKKKEAERITEASAAMSEELANLQVKHCHFVGVFFNLPKYVLGAVIVKNLN